MLVLMPFGRGVLRPLSGLVSVFFFIAFFLCPCEVDFAGFVVAELLLPASLFCAERIAPMLKSTNAPAVHARILNFI